MSGFITDSAVQADRVHNDCVRPVVTTFAGIYELNADGTCPDLDFTWAGSDYSDQPRYRSPADVGHLELIDARGRLVHDFGFVTTTQGGTYTVPGSWLEDADGQGRPGGWFLRCRQPTSGELAAHPGADVTATPDPLFGPDQGMTQFVTVPHDASITLPALGTVPEGGVDSAYWAGVLRIPQRVGVRLRDPDHTPESYHAGNAAAIAQLVAMFKGSDPGRTHPDGLPAEMIFCAFPDYLPEHASLVTAIVAMPEYADVDVFVCTNEIRSDGNPEGGVLSATNVTQQRSFHAAVKAGRADALVGSASSCRFGPAAVPTINGYFTAAGATTPGATVGFDVLILHDYPGDSGTPGYQDDYYGTLADLTWEGPIASDEAVGVPAAEYGGGYPARQARRVMWALRSRAKWGLSPERAAYYAGSTSHPWGTGSGTTSIALGDGVAAGRPGSYPVTGRLYIHRRARKGTSQIPETVLELDDPDDNQLVSACVYRKTTGGAQPAPTSNAGMVDLQVLGDPTMSLQLHLAGAGSSVVVWNADGKVLSAPVVDGVVTVDRALLNTYDDATDTWDGDGLVDGAYVFLPAGCTVTALTEPGVAGLTKIPGLDIDVATDAGKGGVTGVVNVLRPEGEWNNALVYDVSNTGNNVSPWRFEEPLHDGDTRSITFTPAAGAKRLRRVRLAFLPPWQAQSTATRFNVVGIRGGVETVLAEVDTDPAAHVHDWRTDGAGFASWHMTFFDDRHVFTIDCDQIVQAFRVDVFDATYGGAPTKDAADGFGRTSTQSRNPLDFVDAPNLYPPVDQDVETWVGVDPDYPAVTLDDNLLGSGFATSRRPGLQRAWVLAEDVAVTVPSGTPRYVVRALPA